MRLSFLKHLLNSVTALARPALDVYDLALVKLVLGRQKDLDLLRALLKLGILEPTRLRVHYQQTPLSEREATLAGGNLQALLAEHGAP